MMGSLFTQADFKDKSQKLNLLVGVLMGILLLRVHEINQYGYMRILKGMSLIVLVF